MQYFIVIRDLDKDVKFFLVKHTKIKNYKWTFF